MSTPTSCVGVPRHRITVAAYSTYSNSGWRRLSSPGKNPRPWSSAQETFSWATL